MAIFELNAFEYRDLQDAESRDRGAALAWDRFLRAGEGVVSKLPRSPFRAAVVAFLEKRGEVPPARMSPQLWVVGTLKNPRWVLTTMPGESIYERLD